MIKSRGMNDIVITRCLYIDDYLIKIILSRRCPTQWTWLGGNSEFARYMNDEGLTTGQRDNNTYFASNSQRCRERFEEDYLGGSMVW